MTKILTGRDKLVEMRSRQDRFNSVDSISDVCREFLNVKTPKVAEIPAITTRNPKISLRRNETENSGEFIVLKGLNRDFK
jgi:hypothetical protein